MNTSSESTRNIHGINGSLAAIQNNSNTPVLQLTDLHGDIIATASLGETETKLLSTSEASEFGVPTTSTPAKYSWLGAEQQPTELPSGEIAMGARSYVPQLGRFLQPDPRPSGSASAYSYTFGDPVNTSDPSGEFTVATPTWSIELNDRDAQQATEAAEAAIRKAAEEAAARAAAEAAARAAAAAAQMAGSSLDETGDVSGGITPGEVIWEAEDSGCSGMSACASSILGIKVEWSGIDEWWKQVKGGFELIKETVARPLVEDFKENSTVCKTVGYAVAAGSYFIPETKFAKALGVVIGFGSTYAC